jgi:hypothetical protein
MHGGAKGSGAPAGVKNGAYKHGAQTKMAKQQRRVLAALFAECTALAKLIKDQQ